MTLALPERLRQAIIEQLATPAAQHESPASVAHLIDPRTVDTPALRLVDDFVTEIMATPDGRGMIFMAPQEGKSTRVARDLPVWALTRNPDLRIVSGSYAQSLANRNGRAVRNAIMANPSLGLTIAADHGAASEWSIAGHHGGLVSVGRGAGVNGRPADFLIIDDPVKDRAEADSETIRDTCWDWYTDSLSARLAPGAPAILITTRWHEDDLAGRLMREDRGFPWQVLNIPAQCDDADTDPLGREIGEYMISARGRTLEQWENRKATAGARTWAALYQGRPSPGEGGLIKREWWRRYSSPLWMVRDDGSLWATMDEVIISADLAFKGTTTSDYVAIGVWGRRGLDAYLLDQVHGLHDFVSTLRAFEALCHKWPQAVLKLVEDKANGPALIAMLSRRIPGIVPVEPKAGKVQRAEAWAPLAESGHVWLPEQLIATFDVEGYIEEHAAFPNGSHDDQVDQTSQALDRLLLRPMLTGQTIIDDDYDADYRIGY